MEKAEIQFRQEEEIKILRKLVDITCSDFDLHRTLKEVVKIVVEVTHPDSVFIYLYDEKKKNLVLMSTNSTHQSLVGQITLKTGEGITGWVAKENKPVAIKKKAFLDPRFKNFDVLPEDKFEAFLSVPIIYRGKVTGVINVQHKISYAHSTSTINLMKTIAKQVGSVIENARLHEESKKKAAHFDSLAKVSQTITSHHYLDEILSLIVVVTAEMLNSQICSIMILDEKGEELAIKATQSLSEDYKKKPNIKVHKSLSGEVILSKKPLQFYDVRNEERYVYRDLAQKENLTSMLSVPMILKDKAIGIINVYTKEPHHFSQEEIEILQMIANQAAVAVENTKLMEEALKAKEALESRKLVERAKGILMRLNNLTEETAHKMILKKSMDTGKPMKEIAESIILMDEFRK